MIHRSTLCKTLVAASLAVCLTAGASFAGAVISVFTPARMQELSRRSSVTRGDCLAAVAAAVFGRDAPTDPLRLIAALEAKRIVRPREAEHLEGPATRGYASLLFKRAIGNSQSLFATVFSGSEHYAYNHLVFLGLIPAGSSWVSITGPELVSLSSLSRKYLRQEAGK